MNDYIKKAMRTNTESKDSIKKRLDSDDILDILHGAMGLSTEANEVLDNLKKTIYYGYDFDRDNLIEEMGDCMWYLALIADTLGVNFKEIADKNIAKLRTRYPRRFTKEDSLARDTNAERKVIEG